MPRLRYVGGVLVFAVLVILIALYPLTAQSGTVAPASVPGEQVIVIEGRRRPEEAAIARRAMFYLPFDVPPGVTRITISKALDHGPDSTRNNTVDMGLWDSRGGRKDREGHLSAAGFRGWQGGVKSDLVLTGDSATCSPHAIPGLIPAGRWHIAQYYLAAAPAGLGYKYTVRLSFDGPVPKVAPIPKYEPGVLNPAAGWYAGNLHVHTVHSDGSRTLACLVARNVAAGYDFLASTEHNSTTAHYRFAEATRAHPGHLLLYGDEFTSPGGHANILGQRPGHWFDFRLDPADGRLPTIIDEAHQQGAVFMVNHPFAPCTSCPWRYPEREWEKADAIEVWNGAWSPDDRAAVDLWDHHLKQGRRIAAFGGTDYHRGEETLTPASLVYADNLSTKAVMTGLRKGRVLLSASPKGPKVYLGIARHKELFPGDTLGLARREEAVEVVARVTENAPGTMLRLVWHDREVRLPVGEGTNAIVRHRIPFAPAFRHGYVRAELFKGDGSETPVALTNPLYLERR